MSKFYRAFVVVMISALVVLVATANVARGGISTSDFDAILLVTLSMTILGGCFMLKCRFDEFLNGE